MVPQTERILKELLCTSRGSKCDDGGESLVAGREVTIHFKKLESDEFRTRLAYGVGRASTHAYTRLPEVFRCRAGERTNGRTDGRTAVRPSGRRKSSLFGNNDNDDDAGRSIYLEETKAPPMAIISRVYMHRSVHCSVH